MRNDLRFPHRFHERFPVRQRGAILVVSLLLLLVMTALALTASQTTRLQERMAGNARDLDLSFQAAEAALRKAEDRVDGTDAVPNPNLDPCATPADCIVSSLDAPSSYHTTAALEWWGDNAHGLGETLTHVSSEPRYFVSFRGEVPDSLTTGNATTTRSGTRYYTNTSRAVGGSDTAVSIVQTTFAIRYAE